MSCAHRKLSQLLCNTHQPKGSHCFARPALKAGSGARHSYPHDIPKQQSCSSPEQPDIPSIPLLPKQRQALNTLQGTSPEPPWSGREGARGVPAPGAAGHRAAPADYSTQQAPPYRGWDSLPGVTWRPPEPIHGRRRNVNKHGGLRDTRYQRQGRAVPISHARASRGSAAVTRPARGTGWTAAPHPPTHAFRPRLCILRRYFLKSVTNGKENLPRYPAGFN